MDVLAEFQNLLECTYRDGVIDQEAWTTFIRDSIRQVFSTPDWASKVNDQDRTTFNEAVWSTEIGKETP